MNQRQWIFHDDNSVAESPLSRMSAHSYGRTASGVSGQSAVDPGPTADSGARAHAAPDNRGPFESEQSNQTGGTRESFASTHYTDVYGDSSSTSSSIKTPREFSYPLGFFLFFNCLSMLMEYTGGVASGREQGGEGVLIIVFFSSSLMYFSHYFFFFSLFQHPRPASVSKESICLGGKRGEGTGGGLREILSSATTTTQRG